MSKLHCDISTDLCVSVCPGAHVHLQVCGACSVQAVCQTHACAHRGHLGPDESLVLISRGSERTHISLHFICLTLRLSLPPFPTPSCYLCDRYFPSKDKYGYRREEIETPKKSEHGREESRRVMVCPAAFNRDHHCPGRCGSKPQVWLQPGCTIAGQCVCVCVCV